MDKLCNKIFKKNNSEINVNHKLFFYFSIEHNMKGKQGTIDIQVGNPERVHKDKSGHLLIVS